MHLKKSQNSSPAGLLDMQSYYSNAGAQSWSSADVHPDVVLLVVTGLLACIRLIQGAKGPVICVQ